MYDDDEPLIDLDEVLEETRLAFRTADNMDTGLLEEAIFIDEDNRWTSPGQVLIRDPEALGRDPWDAQERLQRALRYRHPVRSGIGDIEIRPLNDELSVVAGLQPFHACTDEGLDVVENPVPPPPSDRRKWWGWIERTFPVGTPVVFRSELLIDPHRVPPGARATVTELVSPPRGVVVVRLVPPVPGTSDPELVAFDDLLRRRGLTRGLADYDVFVDPWEAVDGVIHPMIDTWGSGPAPRSRLALPSSQRMRSNGCDCSNPEPEANPNPEANPVPYPPTDYGHARGWVRRTFPAGAPVRLEFKDSFWAVRPGLLDKVRDEADRGLPISVNYDAFLVRGLPAGTKGVVRANVGPEPHSPTVFVEIPAPPFGAGSDPALEEAFEGWYDDAGHGAPMVLALEMHDIIRAPGAATPTQRSNWWPTVDTWGQGGTPQGRHALPRAQRSWMRPNEPREEVRPNATGAMQRARFGRTVDDDGGEGAERYRIFHDREPRRVVELRHAFPTRVGLAGDALSVLYRTDKWHEDGDDTDYKHVFESGVKVYEPWGAQRWLERAELPHDPEGPLALLGQCLGFFLRRVDDGEVYETKLPHQSDTWLLAAPDGRMLFVYDPRAGFRAIIAGGRLSVEEEGIDH